jgi:hypothetical protein
MSTVEIPVKTTAVAGLRNMESKMHKSERQVAAFAPLRKVYILSGDTIQQ